MKLGDHQEAFTEDIIKLLVFARDKGYKARLGEFQRPLEMQKIYVMTNRSKTMDSDHILKCAGDIHFTKDGEICYPEELGKFWESLNPLNRWGGSWRGKVESGQSKFKDKPHFERHVPR